MRSAPLRAWITPSSKPYCPPLKRLGMPLCTTTLSQRKRAKDAWAVDEKLVGLPQKIHGCFFLSLANFIPCKKSWHPCVLCVKDVSMHGSTNSVQSWTAPWDTRNVSPSEIPRIWNRFEPWVSRSIASLMGRNAPYSGHKIL